jgi:hypothetical protein
MNKEKIDEAFALIQAGLEMVVNYYGEKHAENYKKYIKDNAAGQNYLHTSMNFSKKVAGVKEILDFIGEIRCAIKEGIEAEKIEKITDMD